VVLFIVLDTSVAGAYRSIEELSRVPLGGGRLLRACTVMPPTCWCWRWACICCANGCTGTSAAFRRFHWLTGVPLIGFVFVGAIGGFWINWDELGQFSAIASMEWLDALPLLAAPLARNFLAAEAVNDRLFSLFVFVHIGVPLLLLFGLWFHIQRITRAAVMPPRRLALGVVATLAVLALAWPVASHAPAALARVPAVLRLDWILLFVHPLTDATSPAFVWALVGGGTLLLSRCPSCRSPRAPRWRWWTAPNCNGCRRCFADCPYAAITMVPHPKQRIGRSLAQVDADLCAGCGICAGAWPVVDAVSQCVATRDRHRHAAAHGERPAPPLAAALAASHSPRPLVVFGCDHGARCAALPGSDVSRFSLLCTGQLAPSFVEYALRDGAAGVLLAACAKAAANSASANAGRRAPGRPARTSSARQRGAGTARTRPAGPGDEALLLAGLERLRRRVQPLAPEADLPTRLRHA